MQTGHTKENQMPRPAWIRGRVSWNENTARVCGILKKRNLNTVCAEAACPNKGECWGRGHVTFMVLGGTCTRGCYFCNVNSGIPLAPDVSEPENIAEALRESGAEYAVRTSVTRDDLEDRGAGHFADTVRAVMAKTPGTVVELLIPDLDADRRLLERIAYSGAEVIGHNIEMPERLYEHIRPRADYRRSLKTLRVLNDLRTGRADMFLKSSLIIGLGESEEEILGTLEDLKRAGVDIVYIGQYLSPSPKHWPVKKYYTPEEFDSLAKKAGELGFPAVCAAPMVRSSYRARESYLECKSLKR
ncbi:MAG: lipoyl synthase [Candidatus Omnitrophota bacterium]